MPDSAAPLSASALLLRARQMEIDATHQLAMRADLIDVLGQLIRRLQRERGASGVFLASQGLRFSDERPLLIDESRRAEERLRLAFARHAEPSLCASAACLALMAWVLSSLDELEGLRSQIARQSISAHALIAAYSQPVAGLIELVFLIADTAGVPAVSRLMLALVHLVQAQEEAGQERALGALLYAAGWNSVAQQQRVLRLIESQQRSLAVFEQSADAGVAGRWQEQQQMPCLAGLERLRQNLVSAHPGAVLDTGLSKPWFDVCSERLDGLWSLQTALVQQLRSDCAARIQQARQDLQDPRVLLQKLRENPPLRAQAVDRFFRAGGDKA